MRCLPFAKQVPPDWLPFPNFLFASALHTMSTTPHQNTPGAMPAFVAEIAEVIVSALNLEISPSEIDPDGSLFGEGLGLDSIDILEVALVISKQYGIQLRADDEDNTHIFRSLRSLADYVATSRAP